MKQHIWENYFILIRTGIVAVLEIYLLMYADDLQKLTYGTLFGAALFFGVTVLSVCIRKKRMLICLKLLLAVFMAQSIDVSFFMLFFLSALEVISEWKLPAVWYPFSIVIVVFTKMEHMELWLLLAVLIALVYFQHDKVVFFYRYFAKDEEIVGFLLKHHLQTKEAEYANSLKESRMQSENMILEEKNRISQALHDKLGHSINGSVYQLEACKVLMDKDVQTTKQMLQAVINNLRSSMDEIREILRKERPKKYKLAIMQLKHLCDDCKERGIDCSLSMEGNIDEIPEELLEIILDNAYEAVSNSMKYARCTRIYISLEKLNQVVKCIICDNGIGCEKITYGMGLSGMRERMRRVGGFLDFESDVGFTVKMLLPIETEKERDGTNGKNESNHRR